MHSHAHNIQVLKKFISLLHLIRVPLFSCNNLRHAPISLPKTTMETRVSMTHLGIRLRRGADCPCHQTPALGMGIVHSTQKQITLRRPHVKAFNLRALRPLYLILVMMIRASVLLRIPTTWNLTRIRTH